MTNSQDALELLLPDADDQAVSRARDVTRFLRLLTDDALPSARAGSVDVDLERARNELERADRADLKCAILDLLRHHLTAACSPDSFAWFGDPVHDPRSAWRVLAEFELEHDWIAQVPAPGESCGSVAGRLSANLERLGVDADRLELWRARSLHALEGARPAERAYRAALRGLHAGAHGSSHGRSLLAGIVECLLERGQARDARAFLAEHQALIGSDPRLRQLTAWSRLVLGDAGGARAALVGLRPWSGPIPASLRALRAARPDWLPCLAGKSPDAEERDLMGDGPLGAAGSTAVALEPVRDRHEVGGSVLAVFVFRAGAGAEALHVDVAPGLRVGVQDWVREREDAGFVAASPEQRAIAEARTIVEHALQDVPLRHALGAATTRAAAVAPVLDDDGEVAGWLHLECEHHLMPGLERLSDLAHGWRRSVLAARERDPRASSTSACPARNAEGVPLHDGPGARVFRELVDTLGFKLHQRLWSGFVLESGVPRLVATGGEGVGFERDRPGRGRALARSVATGGCVTFDAPDERLSLHAQACSGFVVPVRIEGQACGFLAIESSRRRDFKAKDVEVAARAAEHAALALRVAQMSAWHAARFRFEPWFDAAREDFRAFAAHLFVAARSRAAAVLFGPAGSGKLVLARWIHFESSESDGPFKVHTCGSETGAARDDAQKNGGLRALLSLARGGTLVLDDVDRLAPAWQEELLRALEGVERATDGDADPALPARIVATTCAGLPAARDAGRLRADLAARLDRLTLIVPPLRERREEIPALAVAMAARFAAEEDCAPPHFADETLALLWRQPWNENLRGLENVVYKLVLLHGGEEVRPEHVTALRRRFGLDLVRKLPSRHPDRRDILSALRVTRLAGGRVNKTRAALYLGWDPDTLVARMASEHVDEERLTDLEAWQANGTEPAEIAVEEPSTNA